MGAATFFLGVGIIGLIICLVVFLIYFVVTLIAPSAKSETFTDILMIATGASVLSLGISFMIMDNSNI